ncbi:MAG TPA: class I SAM-dependent methyltransferase [Bryobacteraceae bacterium]|jgi:SAM-dependent methyltransferase
MLAPTKADVRANSSSPRVEPDTSWLHQWSPGHNPGGTRGYSLHPAELRRRRNRCEPIVNGLRHAGRQFVSACNVCGSERNAIVAQPDRYGFPSRTAMCLNCGLFFLVDRLSDEGYSEFYKSGTYRRLVSAFSGAKQALEEIQSDQVHYAAGLIQSFSGYLKFRPGARLLDVGGSAGQVALEFQNFFGIDATVLDPAEAEVAAAKRAGLEAYTGSIEQWTSKERFDFILLCRTIEHVQDLRGVLARLRGLLTPEGLLYCDIVDFTEACRLIGHPEAVSKIDHCYWMTQESAPGIFRHAGLEIVSMNLSRQQPLMGFLLRRCEPSPWLPVDPLWTKLQLRGFQQRASEWQEWGRWPSDSKDWLRRKAYKLKRALIRSL